jgi:hypothetical protein
MDNDTSDCHRGLSFERSRGPGFEEEPWLKGMAGVEARAFFPICDALRAAQDPDTRRASRASISDHCAPAITGLADTAANPTATTGTGPTVVAGATYRVGPPDGRHSGVSSCADGSWDNCARAFFARAGIRPDAIDGHCSSLRVHTSETRRQQSATSGPPQVIARCTFSEGAQVRRWLRGRPPARPSAARSKGAKAAPSHFADPRRAPVPLRRDSHARPACPVPGLQNARRGGCPSTSPSGRGSASSVDSLSEGLEFPGKSDSNAQKHPG